MLFFVCKFDHLLIAKSCKGKLRKYVFKREDQSKQMYLARKPVEHDYQPSGGGNSSILHLRQSWHGFLSFVLRFFSKSFFVFPQCIFVFSFDAPADCALRESPYTWKLQVGQCFSHVALRHTQLDSTLLETLSESLQLPRKTVS